MRKGREFKIALCGYYGFGNLGDELLAEALLESLEECGIPRSEVIMLSASPRDSERLHAVRSVSRWSPAAVYGALRRSESLLLGGGGLFQDVTSLRSPLYYWGVVRLSLLAGARPWCVGQSVGPFFSAASKRIARSALSRCAVRGVRDARSAQELAEWGLDSTLTCDPVFSLSPPVVSRREGEYLLVNIRPWRGDLPRLTAIEASAYASARSLPVRGFAAAESDVAAMERLRDEGLFPAERIDLVSQSNWRRECKDLFDGAAGVVAMRLHASVLALLFDAPLTAVVYDPKVEALAREWGVPVWHGRGHLPPPSRSGKNTGEAGRAFTGTLRGLCTAVYNDYSTFAGP